MSAMYLSAGPLLDYCAVKWQLKASNSTIKDLSTCAVNIMSKLQLTFKILIFTNVLSALFLSVIYT